MVTVERSVDVLAPVRTVYNQWTQFEEFPSFMEGVKRVDQMGDARLHWVAEIAGQEREWDATIIEQIPDVRVAWASTDGAQNGGMVTFYRLEDNVTRVKLQLEYEPETTVEKVGDALGFVERRAASDLERFREFIEEEGVESGVWRGEIHDGVPTDPEQERSG